MNRKERNEFIEKLYEQYYDTLKRYCFSRLGYDPTLKDNVQDCIHSVFEIAVQKADLLVRSPNVGGWLMQTCVYVVNATQRTLKKQRKNVGAYIDDPEFPAEKFIAVEDVFERWIDQMDLSDQLNTVIRNLSTKDEEIFRMHFIHGITLAQIASEMNLTLSSAKATVHRIRKRLKDNGRSLHQ